jgi:ABC-type uncharacterized transport system permease subunit
MKRTITWMIRWRLFKKIIYKQATNSDYLKVAAVIALPLTIGLNVLAIGLSLLIGLFAPIGGYFISWNVLYRNLIAGYLIILIVLLVNLRILAQSYQPFQEKERSKGDENG